tara:strand:+ start:381 stop:782 length:402 start_codon:yes stop_codon:yes gene_type:complete
MLGGSRSFKAVTNPRTGKARTSKAGKSLRSFKLVAVNGKAAGNCKALASNPKSAASKCFSQWCRINKLQGKCAANVTVVETTRGGHGKTYSYNATRRTHETEVKRKGGKSLTFKYVNKLYTTKNVKNLSSPRK